MDTMMAKSTEATAIGQDKIQAFMKSGQIWMAGCQSIGQTFTASTQAQMEQVMSGWKAMSSVKSFKEALDLQQSLMRSSVVSFVASTHTIAGATMSLIEESVAPISACMSGSVEKSQITAR